MSPDVEDIVDLSPKLLRYNSVSPEDVEEESSPSEETETLISPVEVFKVLYQINLYHY